MIREKVAETIRIATAPPVLISLTLVLFWLLDLEVFASAGELCVGILFLGVFPALAYPIQALVPKLKEKGRDGQRKLAFILSLAGYALGAIAGIAGMATQKMLLVYVSYLASVAILTIVNKCLHEKASGHACSTTGSLCFAVLYIGPACIIPCLAIYAAMAWSSVVLKRHSPRNIATGTLTFLASLAISIAIVGIA